MSKNKNKKPSYSGDKNQANLTENTPNQVEMPLTSGFWLNTRLQASILFITAFLLYANTLQHQYALDDAIVITQNMFTTEGVKGIGGILKYDTFYGFFKEEGKANLVAGGRYRPFTLIMFAIENQLFGQKPFIGHLFNVLWFAATCVLLYLLLLKLLNYYNADKKGEQTASNTFIAFAAALLFTVHPIHTEVVANIKGRDEIIALLGSLSAVWFSLKAFENQGTKYIVYSVLTFVLSLIAVMSKENAITFVVIVPLIYWFFKKNNWIDNLKPLIPFALSAIAFIILRGAVIGYTFGSEQNEMLNNPYIKIVNNQYIPFETGEKMSTIIYTLGKYIGLLIFPYTLTHDYYPNHISIMPFGDPIVTLSLVLHIALLYFMVKNWQKRSLLSFSMAFYFITLSIVSNLVFPVGTHMAERFIFMPSVAFCLICALFFAKILRGGTGKMQMAMGILLAVVALFSLKTITRNPVWKDDYTLFSSDVSTSENSAKVQCAVGGQQIDRAVKMEDKTQRDIQLREAVEHLNRSIQIHPNYKEPYNLLGNAYTHLGEATNAVSAYKNALKIDPSFKVAQSNLNLVAGNAQVQELKNLGLDAGKTKQDFDKAIGYFKQALALAPDDAQIYSYLGTCYGMKGDPKNAIDVLEKALKLREDKQDALNLSQSYKALGNAEKMQEWATKAAGFK
jgi:protein O-mannosyl-transferase